MAPLTGVTARSQKTLRGHMYQEEDDPFQFDEQQLHYEGYDNGAQGGSSQWYTSNLSRPVLPLARQPSSYTLPAPPASSRPRLSYADTPLKDYSGSHVPNSGKLRSLSSSYGESEHSLCRYQLPSPAAIPNRDVTLNHREPKGNFTPTTSPFFNEVATVKHPPTRSINTSSMPVLGGINLISVQELPDRLRPLFPYPFFNRMQSRCFEAAYNCDDNLVVSAPTASGKTTIFELAICRIITTMDTTNTKIVYIGPTKALCEEREEDWCNRFQHLGITCGLLTGDSDSNQQETLRRSQLIITTPEKWDSITRKWQDQDKLMQLVRLLLIDEIHILNEDRGATVEAVVTRMKSTGKAVRLIALSATVPNATDVAMWLGRNSKDNSSPARLQVFGDEFRPCVLQKYVHPFRIRSYLNDFALDHHINSQLPDIIEQYSIGKPIMIFCSTRFSAKSTAKYLAEIWQKASKKLWPGLRDVPHVQEEGLKTMLGAGVAYHHAGVGVKDRKTIEKAYLDGHLMIICCTSTLAVGVNLPCHLVIIKNTVKWTENGMSEFSDLDIMQMLGRAGRPQFGDHGIGVILTKPENVAKYERLAEGTELLESHLHLNLIEHLNAEITLGTIRSLQDAKSWLASTFFFVRLQKNREHYSLSDLPREFNIDQQLEHICTTNISKLRRHDMIEATIYKATEFGELMAKQYIQFNTMINLINMGYGSNVNDVLTTLCCVEDLRDLKLDYRKTSLCKACTSSLNARHRTLPQNKHGEKLALIVQSFLSRAVHQPGPDSKCSNLQYYSERSTLFLRLRHLARCLADCRQILQDGISMGSALELSRSLAAETWDDSPLTMMQLRSVGHSVVYNLSEMFGIKNVAVLKTRPVEQLDRCGKGQLFGAKLLSYANDFPALRITASVQRKETIGGYPSIYCRTEVGFLNTVIPKSFKKNKISLRLLIIRSDGHLVLYKHIQNTDRPSEMVKCFSVSLEEYGQGVICQVSCDEIAGTLQEAIIDPDIPAHMFTPRKKIENSQSCPGSAFVTQAMPQKLSEDHEFIDEDLEVEDFLAAELEDFRDIDSFSMSEDINQFNHSKQQSVSNKTPCSASKSDIRVAMKLIKPTSIKAMSSDNQKEPCKHHCKDKVNCRHPCCKNGLNRPRVKKDAISKDISGNDNRNPKLKNSTTKFPKTSSSKIENYRVSKLPTKVVKPFAVDKHVMSDLNKIHNSTKGHTLPGTLLRKNSVIADEQSAESLIPISHNFDTAGQLDEAWFEDNTELDTRIPRSEPVSNPLSSRKTAPVHVQDQIQRRTPHQRLLDMSSDSELDDFQPQKFSHQVAPKHTEKRKASIDFNMPSKKVCIESQINHVDSSAIPPQLSISIISKNRISSSAAVQDLTQVIGVSSQPTRDEIAEVSQEIASYRPFKDTEGSVIDFMAQFEDCCEFIE